MGKVIFDISMSLDGFMTAANRRPEEPMGDGGLRLVEWAIGGDESKARYLEQAVAALGATICGRTTYDTSLPWWGADGPSGTARRPVFVVTHETPAESPEGGVYTFVTDGTRMFEGVGAGQIQLEPIDVIDTPAATHLRFRVVK
jgi:dihydrofolate reductase